MPNLLTVEQYTEIWHEQKDYLAEIDSQIQKAIADSPNGYGTIDIKVEFRAGIVNKASFYRGGTWLKEKR
jgi:hypothetical protein